jgi:ubiquinone/menaquinone biosynthesis C-methylase UbiE
VALLWQRRRHVVKICRACAGRFDGPGWSCPACGWTATREGPIYRWGDDTPGAIAYDPQHFAEFEPIVNTHFWFVSRNALLAWALRRYCPEARSLLEVGCGSGQVALALRRENPQLRLTGTEAFIEGLRLAAVRVPDAELVVADARDLPFEAEFDVVGAFDVIEHIREDDRAIEQMVRAVKPGGGVIVTVPQHQFLWSAMDERAGHARRYSRALLTARLREQGLLIERITSFVSLLLPAMWASRLLQRGRPSRQEFELPPAVNRSALWMTGLERGLIRAGVPLPAGGSLLAIARRPR